MAAGSPGLSSSPSSTDPVLAPGLSDEDSGVDVKRRRREEEEDGRRRKNRRKSSEPKRRKDVLLMKRFRWEDSDEEEEDFEDDVFRARPGSGDSGLQEEEEETPPKRRRRTRPLEEEEEEPPPRQSVIIRQNDLRQYNEPATPDVAGTSPVPRHPRNYKSMSRQRRIEANARERTRVHTISAAFESLRRAVPTYAHNQKLSKLAILRIASAYIVALACLNRDGGGPQEEEEEDSSSMAECVERCTRTIQAEGRSRRRTTSKD